jgi:hypothetical protein
MMHSRSGFRVALGSLALAVLVAAASPAAHAATAGHRPSVAPAPSLWQLVVGGIEARMLEVLRRVGWGEPSHGGGKRGTALPGTGAILSDGSPNSPGASSDQSGTINPNGG